MFFLAITTTTTTTSVTDSQLKELIDQGVANALAARDADRSQNGEDSHDSGMGARRQASLGRALTWWNSHVMTIGHDVAYVMTWVDLKKKMTDKDYPRGKIKKLKGKLWNLRVKSNDVVGYNQSFQELALLCVRMFPEESDKVKRYVGGLPGIIHGSVVASRLRTNEISDDTSKNYQNQQQPAKGQNVARAYTARCDCPELKNQNHEIQVKGTGALGMVHALRGGETNQDLNNMEDD
nr:reverse transcriptase domain-containing protein [Tanacetum cinerariifolium]